MSSHPASWSRALRPFGRLVAVAAALALAAPAAADVTVFAAASLKNALDSIAGEWEAETGTSVAISYAASSALARQIEEGAPADVFISADQPWMDHLAERDLIDPASRITLLGNRLVLVAADPGVGPLEFDRDLDLVALLDGGRLAIADAEAVPAGRYARAALESLGLWESVASHLAQSENVRAALAFVALGEAPFGIVYATDAEAEPGVTVAATIPEDAHPPIRYPAALVAGAGEEARAFLDHLASAESRAAFEAEGFTFLPDADADTR